MDPLLVQRTRYALKSRFRWPQTCPVNLIVDACGQLMSWLENHPVLKMHLARLQNVETSALVEIEDIFRIMRKEPCESIERSYDASTFESHAAICLHVVRAVGALGGFSHHQAGQGLRSLAVYLGREELWKVEETVEVIRDVALDGLFEFLDERLDSDSAIYAVLLKYKERSQWFHRQRLRGYAAEGLEGKTGERGLAIDLYDYIHGQGVDLVIEQSSASGEPDLVLTNSDGRRLVIDAKYIPDEGKSAVIRKLAHGFHQVARYCNDFSEPTGFLVVFLATSNRLALELEQRDGLDFVSIGGRCVYYLPILISDEPSASKSGIGKEITISLADLVQQVAAEDASQ